MEQSNTSITTKFIDLIKEKIWLVIGGLFSSSILAYISSRLFIRSYLNEIGFNSQLYSTLSDNGNIAVLTFSICITFLALFTQFYVVPSWLRYFYFENISLYEDIHDKNKNIITLFFILCFLSPLSVLLLFYLKLSIYWFFLVAYSSIIFFVWIVYIKKELAFNEKLTILYSGSNAGTAILISLFPFSTILQSLDYKGFSNNWTLTLLLATWTAYSVIQGFLMIQREKVQYIIGVFISLLIVFEISILSPNMIKSSTAEFVGIKDKGAKIYQISQSDYDELNQEIKQFWQLGNICSNNDKDCQMLVANYDNTCNENCHNPVYLHAQIIFRDNKNAIICPPNYKFGKNMNDRCLLIEQNKLTPTSQTEKSLKKNTNIIVDSFVLDDK